MLAFLRTASRVAFAPVWVLWRGYRVLWWAFDDSDGRRAEGAVSVAPPGTPPAADARPNTDAPLHGPEQQASFEIVDTSPRPDPPPLGALRGGFAASLLASIGTGVYLAGGEHPGLSTSGAWMAWAWATLLGAVASVYVVAHVARRQRAERPAGLAAHTRVAVAGVKDATVAAGKSAWGLGGRVARGARACYRGVRSVASGGPVHRAADLASAAARRVAGVFRRSHPPTRSA
jgi:hypothetical protein